MEPSLALYRKVETFAFFDDYTSYWGINAVRVHYKMWMTVNETNRLFLVLLDNTRDKMFAMISDELMSKIERDVTVGEIYCIEKFKDEAILNYPQNCLRHDGHQVSNKQQLIAFENITKMVHLQDDPSFLVYPTVPSIDYLANIPEGDYLTDILGQVCYGKPLDYTIWSDEPRPYVELYLLDRAGSVIPLYMVDTALKNNPSILYAIQARSVIFVTRVKVCLDWQFNYLMASDISTIHINPDMPECEDLKLRFNISA